MRSVTDSFGRCRVCGRGLSACWGSAQWIAWRTGWSEIVLMLPVGFLAWSALHLFNAEEAFAPLLER
jgi:hypothetical protein